MAEHKIMTIFPADGWEGTAGSNAGQMFAAEVRAEGKTTKQGHVLLSNRLYARNISLVDTYIF